MRFPRMTLLLPLLAACYDGGPVCTAEARTSLVLEIRDAVTGQPRAGYATATVVDGDFSETMGPASDSNAVHLTGVWDRAGAYDITVTAPGYLTWTDTNYLVQQGECHVVTLGVTILLQPE
jgi:hypothetical protein